MDVNFFADWINDQINATSTGIMQLPNICRTCDETGFTYEARSTYHDVDNFLPYDTFDSHEECAEMCTDEVECTAYRFDGNNNCYLLRSVSPTPAGAGTGSAGRRCDLVPQCRRKYSIKIRARTFFLFRQNKISELRV